MPACVADSGDVDADGFTMVASKIRYRTLAPAAKAGGRKNRKGRPAVTAADDNEPEQDESAKVAKLRTAIEGRRKLLEIGSWAKSWEGELRRVARARLRRDDDAG